MFTLHDRVFGHRPSNPLLADGGGLFMCAFHAGTKVGTNQATCALEFIPCAVGTV